MTDAAGGARGSARRQDVPHCASQSGHSGQLGPGTNPAWVRIPTLPAGLAFATWSARQARQGGTRAVCAGPQGPAVRMRARGALRLLGHRADSRPAPAPCLRPVSTAAGSKAGEQVCHPSHRDLPLLPGGSSVWRLVSRDSVRAWSSHGGGWEACGSPRPPWDGRPGWGHAGVTRGSHLVVASPLVTAHQ